MTLVALVAATESLRTLCWKGIPADTRPDAWRLLLVRCTNRSSRQCFVRTPRPPARFVTAWRTVGLTKRVIDRTSERPGLSARCPCPPLQHARPQTKVQLLHVCHTTVVAARRRDRASSRLELLLGSTYIASRNILTKYAVTRRSWRCFTRCAFNQCAWALPHSMTDTSATGTERADDWLGAPRLIFVAFGLAD